MSKVTSRTFNPESLKDFPQTLISAIESIDEEVTDEAIKQFMAGGFFQTKQINSFRQIVDRITPVLVLISYSDTRKELEFFLNEAIQKDKRAPQIEQRLRTVQEADKTLSTKKVINKIIDSIRVAVNEYSAQVTSASYSNIIQYFVSQEQLGIVKNRLATRGLAFKITERVGGNIDAAFVFSDFNTATETIGDKIKEAVNNIVGNDLDLNRLLDLGHIAAKTGTSPGTEEYYANFPKLTQVLLNKIFNTAVTTASPKPTNVEDVNDILLDFLKETDQISNTLAVNKDFASGFLSLFVQIGGQVTKLENAVINQARGRTLERAYPGGTSSQALEIFKKELSKITNQWRSKIQREKAKRINKLIVENIKKFVQGKGSPSMLDFIATSIMAKLSGKQINPFKQKSNKSTKSTPVKTTTTSKKNIKPKSKTGKLNIKPFNVPTQIKTKSIIDLTSLLIEINRNLESQIRRNMGSGDRLDILNYRSGRFAGSVKVEKLSESRQGMITAFYSYMKYPYATFSRGGVQERPYTRDPKLLISKSIREIAQTMVTNQLRAVNV